MGLKKAAKDSSVYILICILLYSAWTIVSSQSKLSNDDFYPFPRYCKQRFGGRSAALKLKVRDGVLAKINNELVRETMAQELAAFPDFRVRPCHEPRRKTKAARPR